MTAIFQPHWTDNLPVLAPYALLYGSRTASITQNLDLRSKKGGWLRIGVGRYSTGTLSAGIDVVVRRKLTAASAVHQYGMPLVQFTGGTTYSNQLVNNASNYAAGAQSIAFDGQAYSTAFAHGDVLCFWGQTAIPSASGLLTFASGVDMEIVRCSAGTSTPLIPDSPLNFAHNDNEYFTAADAWDLWLPGGSAYSLVFDAGAVTTASAVFACMADVQTYDYDEKGSV
ncbi:MAG: hypothetical protein ABFC77_03490 [Thermoguttaceae bacterium]